MSSWAKQLIVTVSVEADDPAVVGRVGQYCALDSLARFHALCRRYAVRPSYMLTWSAAEEPRAQAFARAWAAEAEFGAHLHPEEVPPITEGERGNHTLRPSQVEPGRLREKIANLLERVAEATGWRPTSYRSGFFDLSPTHAAAIAEMGIEADSSFGPLEKVGHTHPFLRSPFHPYILDPADPRRALPFSPHASRLTRHAAPSGTYGANGPDATSQESPPSLPLVSNIRHHIPPLVEVPLTSVFRRPFPRRLFGVYFRVPGAVRGALRHLGLAEVLHFRPALASGAELIQVCRRTERMGIPAVMTIHSNELAAGTSRTVPTAAALAAYLERFESVLAWCRERGWASRTLTEAGRLASVERAVQSAR